VYGTLSNVSLTKAKFGISLYPSSITLGQCQTIARDAPKCFSHEDIQHLWKSKSTHKTLQYVHYKDANYALKAF